MDGRTERQREKWQKIDKQKMATIKSTLAYLILHIYINFENASYKGVYNLSLILVLPK